MADIDIQGLWEKGKRANRASQPEIDIDQAIKGKSKTTLYWIKIILWIEFWINVISTPFIIVMLLELKQYALLTFFLVLVAIYLVYYLFLIRLINRFNYLTDVKSSLKRLHKYLNYYLLHYKVLVWTVFPACWIYGTWMGIQEGPGEMPNDPKSWAILIAIMVGIVAIMILITNWLINMIYGRKIKRLKGMVKELEAVE